MEKFIEQYAKREGKKKAFILGNESRVLIGNRRCTARFDTVEIDSKNSFMRNVTTENTILQVTEGNVKLFRGSKESEVERALLLYRIPLSEHSVFGLVLYENGELCDAVFASEELYRALKTLLTYRVAEEKNELDKLLDSINKAETNALSELYLNSEKAY